LTVDGAGCHDASAISEAKQEEGSVKSSDSRNEKYRQRYRDAVQPHLSEPLLALGVFNRPGGIQAIDGEGLAAAVDGDAKEREEAGRRASDQRRARGDADRVHVFGFNARSSSIDVENELMVWERRGLQVQTQSTMTATRLQLTPVGGDTVELEWLKMAGDFNDEAVQALSQPVG